jgi:hypothetical protein
MIPCSMARKRTNSSPQRRETPSSLPPVVLVVLQLVSGAIELVDFAMRQNRDNAHTLAHLGAMRAAQWGLRYHLDRLD